MEKMPNQTGHYSFADEYEYVWNTHLTITTTFKRNIKINFVLALNNILQSSLLCKYFIISKVKILVPKCEGLHYKFCTLWPRECVFWVTSKFK